MLVLIWLGCAIAASVVASAKGRSAALWIGVGLILGPFALLAAVAIAGEGPASARKLKAGFQTGELRRCPFCAEPIQAAAVVCRHCHRDVPPPPARDWLGREIRTPAAGD